MSWIMEVLTLIFLGINSYTDIKIRKISIALGIIFLISGIVCQIFFKENTFLSIIGGFLIGVILLVIGKLTKQAVGPGDGLIFLVSGIYLGFMENFALLLYALVVCALVSIVLLTLKKIKMKDRMPFAPFVLVSFLLILLMEVI